MSDGAARKRRWREDAANREAENQAHRTRRARPGERLAETMRDTLRHQRNAVRRHNDNDGELYL